MSKQQYKVFPNKVELFKFFGKYNDSINVSASSRLPMNGLAIGKQMKAFRTYPEFFGALAELSGLDIDAKASTLRMGTYIVFFNKEPDAVPATPLLSMEVSQPAKDVGEILKQAAALNDEEDKAGSKARLIEFALEKGVTLKSNKGFDKLLIDFESSLKI